MLTIHLLSHGDVISLLKTLVFLGYQATLHNILCIIWLLITLVCSFVVFCIWIFLICSVCQMRDDKSEVHRSTSKYICSILSCADRMQQLLDFGTYIPVICQYTVCIYTPYILGIQAECLWWSARACLLG